MSNVYVIHGLEDRRFVRRLLRLLPSNGYSHWSSRRSGMKEISRAIRNSSLIWVVLSQTSVRSRWLTRELEVALESEHPRMVICAPGFDHRMAHHLADSLWTAPTVDFSLEGEVEAEKLIAALLPPVESEDLDQRGDELAQPISWDPDVFSTSLLDATRRHDHFRAELLVSAIVRHFRASTKAYSAKSAACDLHALRQDREFELMRRYGEAVVQLGTRNDAVRRLLAQALIELKEYARALDVLQSIIEDEKSSKEEVFEAYGLIGRTHKQRYVESGDPLQSASLIRGAISAYETVFLRDSGRCWHGVNAATCLIRATRDGVRVAPLGRAYEIAQHVVKELERRAKNGPLDVWDCASRAEALLALDRYEEAALAVNEYVNHPDMRAFEVSSTYRQFNEVIRLGNDPRGAEILSQLRNAVERYRAGSAISRIRVTDVQTENVSEIVADRSLVIRAADENWQPSDPKLEVRSHIGKIFTARGPAESVSALLQDPMVISIEESRPISTMQCDRSIPFIRIAPEYTGTGAAYAETGDRALIAIIDNGIDVLHEAFRDATGTTRILGVWDQRDSSGPPPAGFLYGTFHDQAAITAYVKAGKVPSPLGRNNNGHGTHVASIAAGRAAGKFAGGVAPDAKLLVVIAASDESIGYSQSHIEALVFIKAFASDQHLPVVVNVSQGMNAGAHDGKSSLEVAFDAFSSSGRDTGRVVVKSAGNERDKHGHAFVTMLANGRELLRWVRDVNADVTDRIECWFSSADEFEFRLRDPFNEWSKIVATAAPERIGIFEKGGPYRLRFTNRHIDNGDSLLVIEIGDGNFKAAAGEWCLEITSLQVPEGGAIHGWIERTRGVATAFVNHSNEDVTISIPGTASSVITVGAVDASNPLQVGSFSSYGPTRDDRRNKPLVCAPGVNVWAACGGTPNLTRVESGTSMAAPHVAGAIALLLSRTEKLGKLPTSNQIASALRQKTQNYTGRWDRGQGYGVIDVAALLAAF